MLTTSNDKSSRQKSAFLTYNLTRANETHPMRKLPFHKNGPFSAVVSISVTYFADKALLAAKYIAK